MLLYFQKNIILKKIKLLYFYFFFSLFSPRILFVKFKFKKDQRIDYPAKEISNMVQDKWKRILIMILSIVIGQAWWAGNLSYHLDSRPKFIRGYLNFVNKKFRS